MILHSIFDCRFRLPAPPSVGTGAGQAGIADFKKWELEDNSIFTFTPLEIMPCSVSSQNDWNF
jgi:hypothetical protein